MKKTLIALAALAATGAFAQVSVYGRLDVGYANTTTTVNGAETKANGVQSHNSVSSLWGIKGSEDLGGGLKANFTLEQDIYPANGNTGVTGAGGGVNNASGFNRTSKVGLSGGFGTIEFGRDYNALFKVIAATDVNALSRISTVQLAANIGGSTMPNLVMYSSPNMSGFQLNVNYGNQDTSSNVSDTVTKVTAVTGSYTNGPLMVAVGSGTTTTKAGAVGVAEGKTEGTVLGASYDFGKFALKGNYITSKATAAGAASSTDSTETNLGATMPMGKVTLVAQIGRNTVKSDLAGGTDVSGSDFVIGADYALSAKTALFAKTGTYAKASGTVAGVADQDTKQTSTAVGIKTVF